MTLKDLIMQTSFKKVSPEVRRVLHGYATPYTPQLIKRFHRAFDMLRDMKPVPNVMKLYVMHCNINGFYDEETFETLRKDNPDIWGGAYSVVGTPWKDLLGMEIDAGSQERLSLEALASIHIPREVEEILPGQFAYCDNLVSVTVDCENPYFDSRDGCNAIIESKTNILISGCNSSVIPNSVVELFDRAFANCSKMETISIPSSVVRIGDSVFEWCYNLTALEIPESVYILGYGVFHGCEKLESVIIRGNNTKLEYGTFDRCSIQTILVPEGTAEQYKEILSQDVHDAIQEQVC